MGEQAALVVIDVQVAIMDGAQGGGPPAYQRDEVLARIGEVLGRSREAKAPVLFVQHEDQAFPRLTPGAAGWAIHPVVAPLHGEPVVRKQVCDAFYGTSLRAELDRLGVTRLVVVGAETDFCVDTTVRRALSLDYDVPLAADAHTHHQRRRGRPDGGADRGPPQRDPGEPPASDAGGVGGAYSGRRLLTDLGAAGSAEGGAPGDRRPAARPRAEGVGGAGR